MSVRWDLTACAFTAAPIRARSLLRTGSLAAMAACGLVAAPGWTEVLDGPAAAIALVLVEVGAIGVLYPELRLRRLRRLDDALCAVRRLSPAEAAAVLRSSPVWSASRRGHRIGDAPAETWRDGCWQLLAFPASHPAGEALAVFAIHVRSRRPLERMTPVLRDADRILGHVTAP